MTDPLCNLPTTVDLPALPRGDSRTFEFFAEGVCWTAVEPDEVDLDPDIPWVEHYWWAEARAGLMNAARYHNGWVPWYGNPPSTYVWWVRNSLGAIFAVTSEWDPVRKGTKVFMYLSSEWSAYMRPATYNWSCRSGEVKTRDEETDDPKTFNNFVTWGQGRIKITPGYTLYSPPPPEG